MKFVLKKDYTHKVNGEIFKTFKRGLVFETDSNDKEFKLHYIEGAAVFSLTPDSMKELDLYFHAMPDVKQENNIGTKTMVCIKPYAEITYGKPVRVEFTENTINLTVDDKWIPIPKDPGFLGKHFSDIYEKSEMQKVLDEARVLSNREIASWHMAQFKDTNKGKGKENE